MANMTSQDDDLSCPSDDEPGSRTGLLDLDADADLSIASEDGGDDDDQSNNNGENVNTIVNDGSGLCAMNNTYGTISDAIKNVDNDNKDDNMDDTEETPLLPNTYFGAGTGTSLKNDLDANADAGAQPFILEKSKVGLFASLTFQWFVPLLTLGNSKEQLDPEDLKSLPLPPSCETSHVCERFELHWNREKEKYYRIRDQSSNGDKKADREFTPSVARCLAYAFGGDFIRAGFLKFIHDMNVFVGPIVLHGLIQFLRDSSAPLINGVYLTAAVTISQTIMSFCLRHYFFKCYLVGLRTRTAIVVQVYKKALVLSSAERQRRTTGEIINYLSVDAQRIQDLTTYLHAIWYSFIQISLSIYFLW